MQLIKICDANLASDIMNNRLTKLGLKYFKTKPSKVLSDNYSFNLEIFKNKSHIGTINHRHIGRVLSGELEFDAFSVISHNGYFSARSDYHSPLEFRPFVYQGDNL